MTKEMPAKYRQGDDFLRMLARAYKSNLCRGEWGDFETQKPLTLAFGWKLSNFDSFFEKLRTGKKVRKRYNRYRGKDRGEKGTQNN